MFSDFYISQCNTDCSTQNFTSLKHLISKTDFTAIKNSGQGSFTVKKGTIDKLLFLLKTIGIYPLQVSMILWYQIYAKVKSFYLMIKYANYQIIIFMNINENIRNERKS